MNVSFLENYTTWNEKPGIYSDQRDVNKIDWYIKRLIKGQIVKEKTKPNSATPVKTNCLKSIIFQAFECIAYHVEI